MTYTHPATPVALTPLTVTFWNVNGRDNIIHYRGMLPDPGGADKLLRSTGAETAAWVAAGTAVLAALGYTPANKAGDTFSGSVTIAGASSDLSVGRNIAAANQVSAPTGSFTNLAATNITATSYGAVAGTTATFSGAASVASLTSAGAIAGASLSSSGNIAATGGLSGASASVTGAVVAGTDISAGDDITAVGDVQGERLISTVPTGTAPLTVASTTEVANLNAAALSGNDWKQPPIAQMTGSPPALTTSYADLTNCSFTADRDGWWLVILVVHCIMLVGDGQPSAQINVGGSAYEEAPGTNASGATNGALAIVISRVQVSGSTTIKGQVKKASGSAGSTCDYAKISGLWLAP